MLYLAGKQQKPATMLRRVLLSLLLFVRLSPISSRSQIINVFVLAGQSNMAGRGGVINDTVSHIVSWDGIVPVQSQPKPSILRLSSDLVWVQAHDPLHADIDFNKINGVGPGMPFANSILTRNPGFGLVGLVPCAIGGTNISQWERGGYLYEQTVRRVMAAAMSGGGAVVRGVLWFQGESDTKSMEDADLYRVRLIQFFTDLRHDLENPTLPIIQVALASGEGPYIDIVREAQLSTSLVNVQCIDAKGLPLEPDGLHLTTPAQVRLGQMLADAFLSPVSFTTTIHAINSATENNIYYTFLSFFFVAPFLFFLGVIL